MVYLLLLHVIQHPQINGSAEFQSHLAITAYFSVEFICTHRACAIMVMLIFGQAGQDLTQGNIVEFYIVDFNCGISNDFTVIIDFCMLR